jgi:hypothetical protein
MAETGEGARNTRRALPLILIVLASIIAILATFAIAAEKQRLLTRTT